MVDNEVDFYNSSGPIQTYASTLRKTLQMICQRCGMRHNSRFADKWLAGHREELKSLKNTEVYDLVSHEQVYSGQQI